MPSMTEDLGRIAGGIVASRRERMQGIVDRHREAGSRHRAVGDQMRQIKTTRRTMGREQRRDLAAGRRSRVSAVEALLRQFHRNHEALAAAERARAAAFMSDLTGRVASLRDGFRASQKARTKSRHDLANALQERLAGYRQDRHDAGAAWHGMPARQAPPSASGPASRPGRHRTMHAMPSEDTGSP